MPGVWLNLSKSGVSTSVGTKGATVNFKGGKARTTVGVPGTGISYTTTHDQARTREPSRSGAAAVVLLILLASMLAFMFLR